MGKYGGKPTVMSTLPIGTKFYVCNGAWSGKIVKNGQGIKCIQIGRDDFIPLIGPHKSHSLDIIIEEMGEEK